jgi:hypothetical protein
MTGKILFILLYSLLILFYALAKFFTFISAGEC